MKKNTKGIILRLSISVSILGFILFKLWPRIGEFTNILATIGLKEICFVFLIFCTIETLAARRISILFKPHQDISISFFKQLKFLLIGLFFNNFMLGATGGDLIRAYYLTLETHHKKTEAATIVFIDRIIGVFTMLIIAIIFLFIGIINNPEFKKYFFYLILFFFFVIGFVALFFSKRILSKIPFLDKFLDKIPFKENLVRIYNAFHLYHSHRRLVVSAFIYSFILQCGSIAIFVVFGKAMGIETNIIYYYSIIPLVFIINALPISIAGLGVGEAACVTLFNLVNVAPEKALALSFANRIALFSFSLIGAFFYLTSTHEPYKEIKKEMEEAQKEILN